jgi:predicted nucleic acid-binding protein
VNVSKDETNVIDALHDTNIVIDILAKHSPAIKWFASVSNLQLGVVPITWFETVRGARNKYEFNQIAGFLKQYDIEHPTENDNNWAMAQYSHFYLSHGVEWEDCMIAAVAACLAIPFYTRNTRHFAMLPNLDLRQPY